MTTCWHILHIISSCILYHPVHYTLLCIIPSWALYHPVHYILLYIHYILLYIISPCALYPPVHYIILYIILSCTLYHPVHYWDVTKLHLWLLLLWSCWLNNCNNYKCSALVNSKQKLAHRSGWYWQTWKSENLFLKLMSSIINCRTKK